ncbi:hypothetical protein NQ024_07005 [Corynebacterium sp. 35RC1]|nr:hypothetical protein [Corynebacterium sp. 35RC1]
MSTKITEALGRTALAHVYEGNDDEYQANTFLQSMAVGSYAAPIGATLAGAILAWALPGNYSLLSILALLPILAHEIAATDWLRNRVPQPKYVPQTRYLGFVMIPCFVMIAGIAYRSTFASLSFAIGGIVGGCIAFWLLPKWTERQRNRAQQHLDAVEEE